MADRMVLVCQFLRDGTRALANPFQGGLGVPARFSFDQTLYSLNDFWILMLCGFSPSPFAANFLSWEDLLPLYLMARRQMFLEMKRFLTMNSKEAGQFSAC